MKHQWYFYILLVTALLTVYKANCQQTGPYRIGSLRVDSLNVRMDSLSIVPSSFILEDVAPGQYFLDPIASKLYLKDSSLLGKVLVYHYKVYTMDFSRPIRHKESSLIEPRRSRYDGAVAILRSVSDMQDDNELISTGAISRGVSVGNNQDLVLNSALNLQLSGKLSDHIGIMASISDKNIPIQPEGNTQYISNINNIFITLYYDSIVNLNAGDVEVCSPSSNFISVSRNLLGMSAKTSFLNWNRVSMKNQIGGGVSKGRYVRQHLVVQDRVQGPYRLYGENNETAIVIVAGSERVYLDGELLLRGQENDYTIDYNTAEITFTPARMMTTEKRVVVEFEYSDRHYVRCALYTYNEFKIGKKRNVDLKVNFFQEQDLKNQSVQPELDVEQKLFLSQLGDREQDAYYDFADSTEYNPNRILYCRKDTLVDGTLYQSIYEYSADASSHLYALSFTYMGPHRGSYVLLRSTANGRVFGWVAPQNGELSGDYSPVMRLSTPKLVQMGSVQAEYRYGEQSFVKSEFAISNFDQNTFSKKEDGNNVGFAYLLNVNHNQKLKTRNGDGRWTLQTVVDWQFVQKNFHPIESFREVEFARNYNLSDDYSTNCSEQILHAVLALFNEKTNRMQYSVNWLSRLGSMSAVRQEWKTQNQWKKTDFNARLSYLTTRDSVEKSDFLSFSGNLLRRFRKIQMGVSDLMEHNVFRDRQLDTLRLNSYAFNEVVLYLKNADSSAYQYNLSYKNRIEFFPEEARLERSKLIHEVSALFQIEKIRNQHFAARATYRCQEQTQDNIALGKENLFLGSVEYTGRFFRNALIVNTYYETGSGLEQKKNYTFLKVAKGQGSYIWIDYNQNGMEELDEFELAAFADEADYVKVWLNSTEYVNVFSSQFVQSVQLRPAAVWGNKTGFRKFLSRFTDVGSLRGQMKHLDLCVNPFYANMDDTNMVGKSLIVNNTFSFNNSSSKFAFDYVVQKSQSKNLLYYGYEKSYVDLQQIVLKSKPIEWLFLQSEYAYSSVFNESEFLSGRNYQIVGHKVAGKIQLQFQHRYMGGLTYSYEQKDNRLSVERISVQNVELSFDCRMAKRGTLLSSCKYVLITGEMGDNGSVSYQMLNGLALGNNAIWNLSYQLAVTEFLQLSLMYEGRVSQGHKVVHIGNVTLKAQF